VFVAGKQAGNNKRRKKKAKVIFIQPLNNIMTIHDAIMRRGGGEGSTSKD